MNELAESIGGWSWRHEAVTTEKVMEVVAVASGLTCSWECSPGDTHLLEAADASTRNVAEPGIAHEGLHPRSELVTGNGRGKSLLQNVSGRFVSCIGSSALRLGGRNLPCLLSDFRYTYFNVAECCFWIRGREPAQQDDDLRDLPSPRILPSTGDDIGERDGMKP
ncbi:hypothetical protein [Hyalangium versicolor]|uniref:hypothetical protein n=1 Tax=Hyalangium versicolor TaxID=2861190 RepID=UPI001CCD258B|nr:hypothetical protein [Hyalangium versicolor]